MRKRSFAWLVVAAFAFTAFSAVWIGLHPGRNRPAVALDDISETLAPLGAAIFCFLAARRRTTTARSTWVLIGLSALSWGLGQADWTVREVILNQNPASLFPSWPDVGYVASIPLGIAGLIALPAFPHLTDPRWSADGRWGSLRQLGDHPGAHLHRFRDRV